MLEPPYRVTKLWQALADGLRQQLLEPMEIAAEEWQEGGLAKSGWKKKLRRKR